MCVCGGGGSFNGIDNNRQNMRPRKAVSNLVTQKTKKWTHTLINISMWVTNFLMVEFVSMLRTPRH